MVQNFTFAGNESLAFDVGKNVRISLRQQLPTPIYWVKIPGTRKIIWNTALVNDFVLNGGHTPSHQKLVEQYLQALKSQKSA